MRIKDQREGEGQGTRKKVCSMSICYTKMCIGACTCKCTCKCDNVHFCVDTCACSSAHRCGYVVDGGYTMADF